MKKIFFCAAVLAATMGLNAQNSYQKVTTAPADWTGTYLIVCESQSVVFNGGADTTTIDAKGTGTAIISGVTITDGVIVGTPQLDTVTFTISATEDEEWPWAIQSASGLYIGHKDAEVPDNGLSAETELKGKCKHTLAIVDGNLIATPKWELGAAYNLQYNKKADQLRFRYFVPNDKEPVQLYKLQSAPTAISNVGATERKVQKVVENGQVIIIRDGVRYNAIGAKL